MIFVNPHSIETVETLSSGETIVRLASGKMLIVAEDRDEIVEMIEQDVPRKHVRDQGQRTGLYGSLLFVLCAQSIIEMEFVHS